MSADGPWFLGVDGGQTGTRGVLVDGEGRVAGRSETGPMTYVSAPGGPEMFEKDLRAIRAGLPPGLEPSAVFLGVCAVYAGTESQRIGERIAAETWPGARIAVESDGVGAWAAGTGGAAGVTVAAGTGTVVVGGNEAGEIAEVSGWGHLLGDPGSAFDLGATAIRLVLRRWDRAHEVSPLGAALLQALGVATPVDAILYVYEDAQDPTRIADLARVVSAFAAAGDPEAIEVQQACARRMAEDVVSALVRLRWEREPVTVATLGSAFRSGRHYRAAFEAAVREQSPVPVLFAEPRLSMPGGDALMACRLGGVPPTDDLIARLVADGLGPEVLGGALPDGDVA